MKDTLQSIWSRFLITADLNESQSEAAREVYGEIENKFSNLLIAKLMPDEALQKQIDYVMTLEMKIAELEKQLSRWIPVSERLPEVIGKSFYSIMVLITDGKYISMGYYDPESERWQTKTQAFFVNVTHWQPLPELPTLPAQTKEEQDGMIWDSELCEYVYPPAQAGEKEEGG